MIAIITSVIMLGVMAAAGVTLSKVSEKAKDREEEQLATELDLLSEHTRKEEFEPVDVIPLFMTDAEQNVKTFSNEKKEIYNVAYSENRKKQLEKASKKEDYRFENPLWAWNPFGTNNLSMYVFFETTEAVSITYTIQVEEKNIPNFTRTFYNGEAKNKTKKHEYQLTGFVPGMKNYIIFKMYNAKEKLVQEEVFSITVPELSSRASKKLEVTLGKSKQTVSNGLYAIFGKKYTWFYDNSGYIRGEIPLQSRGSDKIALIENNMVYSCSTGSFTAVNRLGQVMAMYSMGRYKQYQDFIYNGYGQLWVLVSQENKKSKAIEDMVVSLDLKTGKVKTLLDFEQILPQVEKASKREKGTKKFDWISLNAMLQVDSDALIVSAGEFSSILRINSITSRVPTVQYIIGDKALWKKTKYKKQLLEKEGQAELEEERAAKQAESLVDLGEVSDVFASHFGQSDVYYEADHSLEEGQYYLHIFNCNYGNWPTRKSFKWSAFEGVGTKKKKAKNSYYYKYLVNEKAGTYDLIESFDLTYTKENGSVQPYKNNLILNQGAIKSFSEYDKHGLLIQTFSYQEKDIKHVIKYDMKGFWFD